MKQPVDYINMCKKIASRLTMDNKQDFEDYAQQGFLGVIKAFDRKCPEGVDFDKFVWMHIKSVVWTYKLNDHVIPTKERKLSRCETIDDVSLYDEGYNDCLERMESIVSHIDDEITKEMVILRYKYDFTLKNIGELFGITHEAARLRINGAIEELKCTA